MRTCVAGATCAEREDQRLNEKGIQADLVLIYPIESEESITTAYYERKNKREQSWFGRTRLKMLNEEKAEENIEKEIEKVNHRLEVRADCILKMRKAGLTVVKNPSIDGKSIYLKVTANAERLEKEAKRQGIEMLIKDSVRAHARAHTRCAGTF